MRIGDRVEDSLFKGGANRGLGTIVSIEEDASNYTGEYYAIVQWDSPIPKECPFPSISDDMSEDYSQDLRVINEN